MRVTGKHRTAKVEGPRIAGFGLMMIGAVALVFSVAGAAGAGSNTKVASPAHHTCGTVNTEDGPMAQVLQSVAYGDCGWNTTTTYKQCTCHDTTTTQYVTTTSEDVSGTTVVVTTVPITTATTTTTVPVTTVTTATTGPATTENTMPATTQVTSAPGVVPQGGGATTTSLGVKGISTVSPQASAVSPTSDVLPFTGSNTMPLAIAGIVMLASGFGLTRTRKRRLVR
jgi:LPXTG-motif cell wall-anchored protein